jgi:hypothetical protein
MNWRLWARVLHRDLGYFFVGVVVIFAVSGLAVNHAADWDPDFHVERSAVQFDLPARRAEVTEAKVREALASIESCGDLRAIDFPTDHQLKIFLSDGSMLISLRDGTGIYETVRRRALLYSANRLHLNPKGWWLAFSDIFAVALLVIAVSGLLMLRGRKGFFGRGKWFVSAGVLIPLLALFLYD